MLRWPDILIIGAYLSGLAGIGIYFSRRQTSTEDYFVAKRSIPGWAMGLSLLATIITSVTFIAYPGSAYAGDWSLLVPGLMFVVVLAAAGTVVVPFFRHSVQVSAYEYFGKRFGRRIRLYSSFAFSLGHFLKMAFVLYLLSHGEQHIRLEYRLHPRSGRHDDRFLYADWRGQGSYLDRCASRVCPLGRHLRLYRLSAVSASRRPAGSAERRVAESQV